MCLLVYLVTDSDLPEIPWDKRRPAFNVHRLKRKEKFLRNLPGTNAYMLGSSEGCGCGFISSELDHPEEHAPVQASNQALCEYVEGLIGTEGQLVLFAAWDGDQDKPAVHDSVTSLDLLEYPWDQIFDGPRLLEVRPFPGHRSPKS